MLLIKLKQYVQTRRLVSILELMTKFNLDPDVLRDMLCFLIKKGTVQKTTKTSSCGMKCIKCNPLIIECYEWVK